MVASPTFEAALTTRRSGAAFLRHRPHHRQTAAGDHAPMPNIAVAVVPVATGRQRFGDSRLGESVLAVWLVVRRRTILNDASVGGVDDQHVGLGPAGDFGWD